MLKENFTSRAKKSAVFVSFSDFREPKLGDFREKKFSDFREKNASNERNAYLSQRPFFKQAYPVSIKSRKGCKGRPSNLTWRRKAVKGFPAMACNLCLTLIETWVPQKYFFPSSRNSRLGGDRP
jgi:hypothetical protein